MTKSTGAGAELDILTIPGPGRDRFFFNARAGPGFKLFLLPGRDFLYCRAGIKIFKITGARASPGVEKLKMPGLGTGRDRKAGLSAPQTSLAILNGFAASINEKLGCLLGPTPFSEKNRLRQAGGPTLRSPQATRKNPHLFLLTPPRAFGNWRVRGSLI